MTIAAAAIIKMNIAPDERNASSWEELISLFMPFPFFQHFPYLPDGPVDFPFLDDIRRHEVKHITQRAKQQIPAKKLRGQEWTAAVEIPSRRPCELISNKLDTVLAVAIERY